MALLDKVKNLISQVENEAEKTDKRKGIDEIGGILKSAGVDDEVIRTVIKKCEELSYEKSEAGSADNKAKNADEEEKEEEFEEEKEIANKAKNEEEDKEKEDKEDEEKEEKADNKCKNSMDDVERIIFGGSSKIETGYISKAKRLEMGNNY